MKTGSISTFKYNFRAPGSQVEGPIRFAVGRTVLGKVIVRRSQRGLAIAIPCHRVVRSDGSISGYRWRVERKRVLLAEEAAEAVEFAG